MNNVKTNVTESRPTGRNFLTTPADAPSVGRLNHKPGRYRLIRGIGRGNVAVRRRSGTAGGWAGFTMVLGGVAAVCWDSLMERISWGRIGVLLVICGALISIYAKLKVRTEENSEAFRTGYDLGLEDGDANCRKTHRPVVVDINRRRCACGAPKADKAALKVGDRG